MNHLEIKGQGPGGEEVYARRSVAEPGWMVVAVATTIEAIDTIVDDLRQHYTVTKFSDPVRTVDDRWVACGRVR